VTEPGRERSSGEMSLQADDPLGSNAGVVVGGCGELQAIPGTELHLASELGEPEPDRSGGTDEDLVVGVAVEVVDVTGAVGPALHCQALLPEPSGQSLVEVPARRRSVPGHGISPQETDTPISRPTA